ncbi:MAG: ABC transporter permease, partial [Gemmatimonadaceae bacterium]
MDGARQLVGGIAVQNPVRPTEKDAKYLRDNSTMLAEIEPQQDRNVQVTYRNQNTNTQVTGATANFPAVRGYEMDVGRMFTEQEDQARRLVCVLGSDVIEMMNMPSAESVIGDHVRIAGVQFTIVGVLKGKGTRGQFGEPDSQIIIPFKTGRFRMLGTPYINDLFVMAASEDNVPASLIELEQLLLRSHKIATGKPDDFRIRSSDEYLKTLTETSQTFTLLLSGIASVSLLVGRIGIMNIMLVSVTERTREIGIRLAIGALERDVLVQFLIEAVALSLLGGVAGVVLG